MIWRKAPDVGASESLPGWVSDEAGRDKSILTETLSADPEASSIESRLLEAVKSASATNTRLKANGPGKYEEKTNDVKATKNSDDDDDDDEKESTPAVVKSDETKHKSIEKHAKGDVTHTTTSKEKSKPNDDDDDDDDDDYDDDNDDNDDDDITQSKKTHRKHEDADDSDVRRPAHKDHDSEKDVSKHRKHDSEEDEDDSSNKHHS